MPSRKFEPPLHIELEPSRRLLILLLAIHVGGALLALFFEVVWVIKLFLLGVVVASAIASLYKSGWITWGLLAESRLLLRWQNIPRLTWQSDNDWLLSTRAGQDVVAQLLPTSTCHLFFVALNFRTEHANWLNRYTSVVIFADAIDKEIFRQLRIRLRTRFVQA